jgi:hypothetical protein
MYSLNQEVLLILILLSLPLPEAPYLGADLFELALLLKVEEGGSEEGHEHEDQGDDEGT